MISNNFKRQYMSIHYDKEDSYRNGPLFVLYKHISIRFYYIAKGAAKTLLLKAFFRENKNAPFNHENKKCPK